jgi:DNA-binding MarR family transcriptional regulator
MKTDELYLEIHFLIAVIAKKTLHALEQRLDLASAGISRLQFGILHALNHKEQTISELSRNFMLNPSTLVPAVDALERKGLARRGRDPNDRRRLPISLTEEGVGFITKVHSLARDNPLIQSLKALDEEKCYELAELLRELVGHMPEGKDVLHKVQSRVELHLTQDNDRSEH